MSKAPPAGKSTAAVASLPTSTNHLSVPGTADAVHKQPKVKTPRAEDIYDGLYGADKFRGCILKPSHLKKVWSGSNMKEELI